jgi:RNA polymerase sigma factor (sigma-70 family)
VDSQTNEALQELILACINQNHRSQELLYKQFFEYGMRVCLRYTNTYEEAVEVLNDGFLRVFTKLNMYNPELSFAGWLRKIMIHTALNYHKKNKKYQFHQEIEKVKNLTVEEYGVEQQMDYEEVAQLIQQLSPTYRTVFNLYVIDGYKHEEIANILNISVGSSKSNLSKARINLREMLKKKELADYTSHGR